MTAPTAYPLAWPDGHPRDPKPRASKFKVTLHQALKDLNDELRLFGEETGRKVENVVISSNVTLGSTRPDDCGVAVYFSWDGEQRGIAVDRYLKVEDNVRAIYYILNGRRQEMRHGGLTIVRAAFRGFTALPNPDRQNWRSTLGLGPDAGLTAAEAAYRTGVKQFHPDRPTGDAEQFHKINQAIEQARTELS